MCVKLYTRRDLAKLLSIGIAGTALESSGAITRSAQALRGAMMAIAKGEVMKTVKTDSDITTGAQFLIWAKSLESSGIAAYPYYVIKKGEDITSGEVLFHYISTSRGGTQIWAYVKPGSNTISYSSNLNTSPATPLDVKAGTEYYVSNVSIT